MGVDVRIYLKVKDGVESPRLERSLPAGCEIFKAPEWGPETSTHGIDQYWRYYGEGYARGPWVDICAVLMLLLSSPDVEKVWYGGDNKEIPDECTPETVLRISAYFMSHGERPYRGPWSNM